MFRCSPTGHFKRFRILVLPLHVHKNRRRLFGMDFVFESVKGNFVTFNLIYFRGLSSISIDFIQSLAIDVISDFFCDYRSVIDWPIANESISVN